MPSLIYPNSLLFGKPFIRGGHLPSQRQESIQEMVHVISILQNDAGIHSALQTRKRKQGQEMHSMRETHE
jgi:hypothetical protein